jgi:cardiolipin synthase (CMP-forming)
MGVVATGAHTAIYRNMEAISTRPLQSHIFALPNLLTYARIVAVPAVAACLYWQGFSGGGAWLRWLALILFAAAAVTDFFDGYLARILGKQSAFGRMLDPIADKLLVACCLLVLAADGTIRSWSLWAALIILCREILVSGLREHLAELHVGVPVKRLAKWKTAAQLVAIGFLIAGRAGDAIFPGVTITGLVLLWVAAAVTAYTGWDYFRAGARHLLRE